MTPRTVARQAPLSTGLSRQEYWSELLFPSPGDLPDPGIELDLLHCRQILYCLSHPWKVIIFSFLEESHMTWTFSRRKGTSRIWYLGGPGLRVEHRPKEGRELRSCSHHLPSYCPPEPSPCPLPVSSAPVLHVQAPAPTLVLSHMVLSAEFTHWCPLSWMVHRWAPVQGDQLSVSPGRPQERVREV